MPDADDVANTPLSQTSRVMHGVPSPRRRTTVPPRRISSAPDLRGPSSSDSSSVSIEEPSSSASSSRSLSSDSPHWHPLEVAGPSTPEAAHHVERALPLRSATEPSPTLEPPQQQPPTVESAARTLEEVHRVIRELQRRRRRSGFRGLWITTQAFFGYGPDGSVARRDVMGLIVKALFGVGQLAAIIALLDIAAKVKSPTDSEDNEWETCRRPLGVWCAIWGVRTVLNNLLAYWIYRRKLARSRSSRTTAGGDAVNEANPPSTADNDGLSTTTSQIASNRSRTRAQTTFKVSEITFARLTTVFSLLSLTWFVTAHVLLYTSVHTCRISSPHLWWLTFGIICIGYLLIVEVIFVAFVVFILGPLVFIVLNLILICMGRHPLRHPNHINPEIGKLPQKAVDLIPLVLYIPAPVPKETKTTGDITHDISESPTGQTSDASASPLAVPEAAHVHTYPPAPAKPSVSPPTTPSNTSQRSRHRFIFRSIRLRRHARSDVENGKEKKTKSGSPERGQQYEDKWERGDYPFVKLEGNRAACAICLCDFDEPRRVRYSIDSRPAEDLDREEKAVGGGSANSEDGGLRLADAGEGAQPLRLLACAHVFHKSCLDPWLTEVSGRCPVCQRPVEVDNPTTMSEGRRRQRT